ncbi:MAG: hypothetical protein QOF83_2466 [Solirubrobacteraceae bacterium]|nr:hypothetical protein [Solirubrobacteraceae bacterium]
MSARWKLTVRSGPRVERSRFATLPDALAALEARAQELAKTAPGRVVDAKIKRFAPVEQVVARLEVAGPERLVPSVRAGVDVRGDGSVESYHGRVRRQPIAVARGETPYGALAREVSSPGARGSG